MAKKGRKEGYRKDGEVSNQTISFSLTESQKNQLNTYCDTSGIKVTKLIRNLLIKEKVIIDNTKSTKQTKKQRLDVFGNPIKHFDILGLPTTRNPRRDTFADVTVYKKVRTDLGVYGHHMKLNENYGYFLYNKYINCRISKNIYQLLKHGDNGIDIIGIDMQDNIKKEIDDVIVPQCEGKLDSVECSEGILRIVGRFLIDTKSYKKHEQENQKKSKNIDTSFDFEQINEARKLLGLVEKKTRTNFDFNFN